MAQKTQEALVVWSRVEWTFTETNGVVDYDNYAVKSCKAVNTGEQRESNGLCKCVSSSFALLKHRTILDSSLI